MPLDDLAVRVVMRRLDQDDEESPRASAERPRLGHHRRRNRRFRGSRITQFRPPEPLTQPMRHDPGAIIPQVAVGSHGFRGRRDEIRGQPPTRARGPERQVTGIVADRTACRRTGGISPRAPLRSRQGFSNQIGHQYDQQEHEAENDEEILEMRPAPAARPVKPRPPATSEIRRKMKAQRSIVGSISL